MESRFFWGHLCCFDRSCPSISIIFRQTALEEERTREASTITEVAWLDRTVPVASPAVRVALSQSRGIEHEIAQGQLDDFDVMMSTYDRLFVQYGDALAALNTEMEVCCSVRMVMRGGGRRERVC